MKKTQIMFFLSILFTLNVISGCFTTDSGKCIRAFSEATVLTTQNTIDAFTMVEKNYYETQLAKIICDYDTKGFKPDSIKRFLSPADINARVIVLKGLQKYSEKLTQIMGEAQLEKFDKETKKLGVALNSINSSIVKKNLLNFSKPSANEIDAFTTAVNAIGRWFIEDKRKKEVKKIVVEMHSNIESICKLLKKDIGSENAETGIPKSGLRNQSWRLYKDTMKIQDSFIQYNKQKLNPIVKRNEIKYLVSLASGQRRADETLKSIQNALTKLTDTHSKLNEAFNKNTMEINNLIEQLTEEGKRIRDYYESL